MEEVLQELPVSDPTQQPGSFFYKMLVLSFLLHVGFSAYLLLNPQRGAGSRSVTWLDLAMTTPAAPAVPAAPRTAQILPHAPMEQASVPPVPAAPPSEFEKLQKDLQQTLETAGVKPETVQQQSLGLGITRGFFRSIGEGETLRPDIRSYYFSMLQSINEKWWLDKNIERGRIGEVLLNIVIARNGAIVDKQLLRSSCNAAYDREVLRAVGAAGPLPPLPESYLGDFFQTPLRLVPPLSLMTS
jgi:periplasmic protein TonB